MTFDEYSDLDATALAALVAARAVTPAELLDTAIAATEAANPALNFIAQPLHNRARRRAAQPFAGPFGGVPFLVKDLHLHIAGERSGEGSRLWDGYVADHDSTLFERFEAAGFNTFGKTTTPEFGLTVTTESRAYGLTRNPWNPDRSAGGSSGGAAAAVAARVVPAAHASDGGGSIRCPAAACGLFGLKPSRGRVPVGPRATEGWFGLTVNHVVTRSVRDSAAILDCIHGAEAGSRYVAPPPPRPFLAMTERPGPRLRVALMLEPITGVPVDPQVAAATRDAARLLETLGHHVEEASPSLDAAALNAGMTATVGASTAHEVARRLQELGRDDAGDDIEPVPQMWVHIGKRTTAVELAAANFAFQTAAIALATFMERFDVILSPVFAQPVIGLGRIDLSPTDIARWTAAITGYSPFTALANWTGVPAMSLPLAHDADGLPIGIMVTGRYGAEPLLFQLAAEVEAAAPWAGRRPARVALRQTNG
ncbi:MAG: amidase [Sphingomonadaceae bacterium]|nr:amidase [Sphingomonadaceae bacterium]